MNMNGWNDRYNCHGNEGYLEGDLNQSHRNACHLRDRSRSLTEMHSRDKTFEELSLPFQTYAAGRCIRAAITEPQQDYHSTFLLERAHCGVNSDEVGKSSRGIGFDQKCRFLNDSAPQIQMEHGPVAMNTSHPSFRYGRENPGSQYIFRSGATYGYNDCHLKDPGRNQCNKFPLENFGSQEQIVSEDAASHNASDLSSFQRWAISNNSGDQSTPASTGNLSVQAVPHAAKLTSELHSGYIAQRASAGNINSEKFHCTIGKNINSSVKTGLHTAGFIAPQNSAAPQLLNDQTHQNEFSVHSKIQGEFVAPHPLVDSPALSSQGQPVCPGVQALPDLSAHSGQMFNYNGQIQDLVAIVRASQSTAIPKQVPDSIAQSTTSTKNLQPVSLNVQGEHQSLQKLSSDLVGSRIDHNAATSEGAYMNPNLAPYNSNAPITAVPVQKQSSKSNLDPRLAASSSAAPPSVPVPPNQQAVIVQPETSALSVGTVYKFEIAIDSSGKPAILSHSVALSADNSTVNASEGNNAGTAAGNSTVNPSEGNNAVTTQAKENHSIKQSKAQMFKIALTNFVKDGLKETWRRGCLTKELHKVIVRKVVEKVMSSEKIPETEHRIESYLKSNKENIERLIQDYLDKYTNVKRLPTPEHLGG